jgi:hypothetical protein
MLPSSLRTSQVTRSSFGGIGQSIQQADPSAKLKNAKILMPECAPNARFKVTSSQVGRANKRHSFTRERLNRYRSREAL